MDNAFDRARAAYGTGAYDDATLEFLFPQLKESRDEQMLKAALEGIEYLECKLGWDAIGDTDILDVKEYLEKQKDAEVLQGYISYMNGNNVPMATMDQQEQPEVDLEKLGEIARHIIAVKQNVEDMRLNEDEWSLLERIGYPHKLNARKEE